jgi:hypothetical protein
MMRARIIDAIGPRWTRLSLPALACAAIAADQSVARLDLDASGPATFVGVALLAVASPLLGRHRARDAEVAIARGAIHVRRAGLLSQTIDARTVTGASTTTSSGGVELAIAREGREEHPILLSLETEAEADAVRRALGVGHFGAGSLAWKAAEVARDRILRAVRVLVALAALGVAGARVLHPDEPVLPLLLPIGALVLVAAMALRERWDSRLEGMIVLDARGLHYGRGAFVETIRFEDIETADVVPEGVLVTQRPPARAVLLPVTRVHHTQTGMTGAELDHVVLQIRAAARRAHGEGRARPELPDASGIARRDADASAWVTRLDATAELLARGREYRGAPTEAHLWALLEDADADADLRGAAARVLVRARPEARDRIDAALATIRDLRTALRVRVMLEPDAASASRAIAALDRRASERLAAQN